MKEKPMFSVFCLYCRISLNAARGAQYNLVLTIHVSLQDSSLHIAQKIAWLDGYNIKRKDERMQGGD